MTLRALTAALAAAVAACAQGEAVCGTFVQRRLLKDVGVALTSSGEWSFERERCFVWRTIRPAPSLFTATPTNYTFTAGGRTTSRNLEMRIDDIAQLFGMKEMKGLVDGVECDRENPVFSDGKVTIPSSVRVSFRNGDRLDISISKGGRRADGR